MKTVLLNVAESLKNNCWLLFLECVTPALSIIIFRPSKKEKEKPDRLLAQRNQRRTFKKKLLQQDGIVLKDKQQCVFFNKTNSFVSV